METLLDGGKGLPMTAASGRADTGRVQAGIAYTVLLFGGTFGGLLQALLTPILPLAADHFGGGTRGAITAQMIATFSGLGVMIGGPLLGLLTPRIGVRAMLLFSLAFYAISGSAGLFVESPVLLFISRFLQGAASAGIVITTSTLIAARFTGHARPRFLGFQGALMAVVAFVGLLGSGLLAEWWGWRAPFALFLLTLPVMLLVILAGRELTAEDKQVVRASVEKASAAILGSFAPLLGLWRLYLMMILIYTASWMIYLQLPFVLADEHISSPSMQSQIIATGTVVHFLGGLFYGRMEQRMGGHWMFLFILACMVLSNLLVFLAQNTAWVVVACGFAGLAGGNLMIFLQNLLLGRAPAHARPKAIALMFTAMYLGDFLNPLLATPLRMWIGNREAFLAVAVLLLAFLVVQIVRGPQRSVARTMPIDGE